MSAWNQLVNKIYFTNRQFIEFGSWGIMSKHAQVYYTGIVQDVYTYTVSVHSAPVRTFTVNHIVFTNKSQDSRQWKQTQKPSIAT